MKFTVTAESPVKYRQGCEYAAWYTNMQANPGTYELVPFHGEKGARGFWNAKPYSVKLPSMVTDDYYGTHYGGMPISEYDCTKNAGNPCSFVKTWNNLQAIIDPAITFDSDEEYDAVLSKAIAEQVKTIGYRTDRIKELLEVPIDGTRSVDSWAFTSFAKEVATLDRLQNIVRQREYFRTAHYRTHPVIPTFLNPQGLE